MSTPLETDTKAHEVREVVARFDSAEAFETAIEAVEEAGIDRAAINMMASSDAVEKKLGHLYRSTADYENEEKTPEAVYTTRYEMAEGKAAAVGIPMYIGGAAGGAAVVASGGTLAIAALIAAAGAAAGAGFGALVARSLSKTHADRLEEQLKHGGLLLWVAVEEGSQEQRVIDILQKAGGMDAHGHTMTRYWGTENVPLHDFNPDPFLESKPE
ncbi:MAG: hypothetical protein EP348_11000 [Alphaproteobacteria bacterium]|nr:MAG: hypothetical protein EP348_11000 [Alphaproteobacteria bacterium]